MSRKRSASASQRLITIPQGTEYTGIPERSIYDQITRGALPFVRFPGSRRIWLDRGDLDALIERSKEVRA